MFFFIFICKPEGNTPGEKFRDVLFEVICGNEILQRFDTSHKFWETFGLRNTFLKKQLGDYDVENIDDTFAVNPKEYFEKFESEKTNSKHIWLGKGALGMEFESYAKRINSVKGIETFSQNLPGKQKQNRFVIKQNEIFLEEIGKSKLVQMHFSLFSSFVTRNNQFKREKKMSSVCKRKNISSYKWKNLPYKKTIEYPL